MLIKVILLNSLKDCCGCTACASICNNNAISLQEDSLGFVYPIVSTDKCIKCGLCVRVCPFNTKQKQNSFEPIAYAARHIMKQEVMTSRSGASFIALADWIIKNGGVVYGAGYGKHFAVMHKRASNRLELLEFKGSKYSQSDMRGVYEQVIIDLKNNKMVCFSGTPCQIAAIKSFVPDRYHNNLYLIDIVCHGVASPRIWQDYLTYIEKLYCGQVEAVNFRDKVLFGWEDHRESFVINGRRRTFRHSYYHSIHFRPSCSNCKFTSLNRPADVTIADFWGVEKVAPDFNADGNGCNLLLVNTEKGHQWLTSISGDLFKKKVDINDCLQYNLQYPTSQHAFHDKFKLDYDNEGFMYVMKKYCEWGIKKRVIRMFNKILMKLRILS